MKKFLIALSFAAVLGGGIYATSHSSKGTEGEDAILFASVEALSAGESSSNTGPATIVSCAGGGFRKFCLCQNSMNCTERECE